VDRADDARRAGVRLGTGPTGHRLVFIADEVDGVPEMLRAVTARPGEDGACEAPIAREHIGQPTFMR